MRLFKEWFEKRKKLIESAKEQELTRLKKDKAENQERLNGYIAMMEDRYCSIHQKNCTADCIHFHRGGVRFFDGSDGMRPSFFFIDLPRCLLWRK